MPGARTCARISKDGGETGRSTHGRLGPLDLVPRGPRDGLGAASGKIGFLNPGPGHREPHRAALDALFGMGRAVTCCGRTIILQRLRRTGGSIDAVVTDLGILAVDLSHRVDAEAALESRAPQHAVFTT